MPQITRLVGFGGYGRIGQPGLVDLGCLRTNRRPLGRQKGHLRIPGFQDHYSIRKCFCRRALNQLSWEIAKDQFGTQGADFIGVMGALMIRSAKDQFRAYFIDPTRLSGTLPAPPRKTSPGLGHTEPVGGHATGVSPTRPVANPPGRQRGRSRAPDCRPAL